MLPRHDDGPEIAPAGQLVFQRGPWLARRCFKMPPAHHVDLGFTSAATACTAASQARQPSAPGARRTPPLWAVSGSTGKAPSAQSAPTRFRAESGPQRGQHRRPPGAPAASRRSRSAIRGLSADKPPQRWCPRQRSSIASRQPPDDLLRRHAAGSVRAAPPRPPRHASASATPKSVGFTSPDNLFAFALARFNRSYYLMADWVPGSFTR
jgi:hypothetical protein